MRRTVILLLVGLLLAGCAGGATTGDAEGLSGTETPPPGEARGPEVGDRATAGLDVAFQIVEGRRVIRTGNLQLHASDTRATFDQIVALTESLGGFVANAQIVPPHRDGAEPTVTMTIRVPAESLTAAMLTIKGFADEVVSEAVTAQDVSEQFVDLKARLVNLEAFEAELRALLEEVRRQPDADPDKLLRVFQELNSVRGQIEQIQGQLNYLSDLTQLASVQIGVTQTPAAVPIVKDPWAPAEAAREAARNLVSALQNIANWLIGFAIYTLPVLILILAIPLLVGVWAYRKWWKPRFRKTPISPAQA